MHLLIQPTRSASQMECALMTRNGSRSSSRVARRLAAARPPPAAATARQRGRRSRRGVVASAGRSTSRSSAPRSARSNRRSRSRARCAARTRVGIKPKLPGRLERVLVDIGDRVSAGQVVATIDRGEVDAQVDAATPPSAWPSCARERRGRAGQRGHRARAREDAVRGRRPAAAAARRRGNRPSLRRRAARPRQGQPGAGRGDGASRPRGPARHDASRPGRRLRRRAQLRCRAPFPATCPVVVVADVRQLKLEAGVSELEAGRLEDRAAGDGVGAGQAGRDVSPDSSPRSRRKSTSATATSASRCASPTPTARCWPACMRRARLVVAAADNALTLPREAVTTRDGKRVVLKVDGDKVTPRRGGRRPDRRPAGPDRVGPRRRRPGDRRRPAAAAGRRPRQSRSCSSAERAVAGLSADLDS